MLLNTFCCMSDNIPCEINFLNTSTLCGCHLLLYKETPFCFIKVSKSIILITPIYNKSFY